MLVQARRVWARGYSFCEISSEKLQVALQRAAKEKRGKEQASRSTACSVLNSSDSCGGELDMAPLAPRGGAVETLSATRSV